MKSVLLSLSVMASVTTLSTSAVAAERIGQRASVPAAVTVQAVSEFAGAQASGLAVYPTADREIVFVTYRTAGGAQRGDHIGLIETRRGQMIRFTDLTGVQPRVLHRPTTVRTGDAQAQARELLVAATTPAPKTVTAAGLAPTRAPVSAQSQAADLLRSASPVTPPADRRRLLARGTPAVHGDSQAAARAVLTATGE